eukprot:scaffold2404_cov398-Prasinococcus_capsulatus_cf.AAC.23
MPRRASISRDHGILTDFRSAAHASSPCHFSTGDWWHQVHPPKERSEGEGGPPRLVRTMPPKSMDLLQVDP